LVKRAKLNLSKTAAPMTKKIPRRSACACDVNNLRNTYYVLQFIRANIFLEEIIMQRKLTITLDEEVYEGLWRRVGRRRISNYIENLVRPHVIDSSLDNGYKAMAADVERETEAAQWCNSLAGDMTSSPCGFPQSISSVIKKPPS